MIPMLFMYIINGALQHFWATNQIQGETQHRMHTRIRISQSTYIILDQERINRAATVLLEPRSTTSRDSTQK